MYILDDSYSESVEYGNGVGQTAYFRTGWKMGEEKNYRDA